MIKIVMMIFMWGALVQVLLAETVLPWMFPNLVFWVAMFLGACIMEATEAIKNG